MKKTLSKLWREIKKPLARLYYFAQARKAGASPNTFAKFEPYKNAISICDDGKVALPYLEIDIVIGCNLKCEHCTHLSPFRKGFVPADEVIRWFRLWSEKISLGNLGLLGGEPLLHPELPRILRESKAIWSQTGISLTTNGLLFSRVSSDVFKALEETQIPVIISNHSSNESEQRQFVEAVAGLQKVSFPYKIRKSHRKWMTLYDKTSDGTPTMFSSAPQAAWDACLSKMCPLLANNKLYKCSILGSVIEGISEGALSQEHWSSALSYKPLTLEASSQEIVEHLSCRQVPACSICPDKKRWISPKQIVKQT